MREIKINLKARNKQTKKKKKEERRGLGTKK
jgi:hypothetical protein